MKLIKKIFRAEFSLFWLIAGALVFFAVAQPAFFSFFNLMNVLKNASYMGLMVLGVTWVIAANEMDCSFPDIAACASMVFAYLALNGTGLGIALLAAVAAGVLCGALTSLLVVKFHYHSLITTIAVSTVVKSIAAALNGGMPLSVPVIKSSWLYKFINGNVAGIPMIFIIVLMIYIVLFLIQEKIKYGQYVYALGENRQAMREAGIKEERILTSIFITSALFAALAGVLMVFVVYGSGQPKMGSAFFLDGFTVVFLGAMVLKLGKTNVVGTFLGGIMLAMIVMVAFGQKKRRGKAGVLKYE